MATISPVPAPSLWTRLERAVQAYESALGESDDSRAALQAMLKSLVELSGWQQAWLILNGFFDREITNHAASATVHATIDTPTTTSHVASDRTSEFHGTANLPFALPCDSLPSPLLNSIEAGSWHATQSHETWFRLQPIIVSQQCCGWVICQTQSLVTTPPPADEAEMLWAWSEWLSQQLDKQRQRDELRGRDLRQHLRAVELENASLPKSRRRQNYAILASRLQQFDRVVVVQVIGERPSQMIAVSDAQHWDRRTAWYDLLSRVSSTLAQTKSPTSMTLMPSNTSGLSKEGQSKPVAEQVSLVPLSDLGPLLPTHASACVRVEMKPNQIWYWWFFSSRPQTLKLETSVSEFLIDCTLRLQAETARDAAGSFLRQPFRTLLQHSQARLLGLAALCLLLGLIPLPLRIVVQGELQPLEQRHLFAPENGRVVVLGPVDGQSITAGTELVRLVDDRLDEEWAELTGNLDSLDAERRSIESRLASLSPVDAESVAETDRLRSRAALIEVQRRGISARREVLNRRRISMSIQAPIDGKVISAETRRRLSDRPVKRGESLFVMANPTGPWEARLKVDPLDWSELAHQIEVRERGDQSLMATLSLDAVHQQSFRGTVQQFSGIPLFDSRGSISGSLIVPVLDPVPADLPAGTRVVAWIECGRKPAALVLFRRFLNWSRWHGWL